MKTALIAGGTSGIGLSIARALIDADWRVLLIARNADKGGAVAASLNAVKPGRVEFVQLDLSDIRAVASYADRLSETHDSLDLLANVAGVMEPQRRLTRDGFETTFAVGYLSAFVLSTRLAPLLEKAPNARIANVAGVAKFIFGAALDFDDLTFSRGYSSFKTAITTVHAKTVLTEVLSEKYASRGIDVNSFHPGAVRSNLMKNMPWWLRLLFSVPTLFMTEDSKTGIRVCRDSDLQGITGKYFTDKGTVELHFDSAYRQRLWQETESMLDTLVPSCE